MTFYDIFCFMSFMICFITLSSERGYTFLLTLGNIGHPEIIFERSSFDETSATKKPQVIAVNGTNILIDHFVMSSLMYSHWATNASMTAGGAGSSVSPITRY